MKTIIGFGAPHKAGTAAVHGSHLGVVEAKTTKCAIGWTSAPFEIPLDLATKWRAIGECGREARKNWEAKFAKLTPEVSTKFSRRISGDLPLAYSAAVAAARKNQFSARKKPQPARPAKWHWKPLPSLYLISLLAQLI